MIDGTMKEKVKAEEIIIIIKNGKQQTKFKNKKIKN